MSDTVQTGPYDLFALALSIFALLLLGLLACSPAAGGPGRPPAAAEAGVVAPAASAASVADAVDAGWRADWDRTVMAAKREGRLVVAAAIVYLEGYLWDRPGAKAACLKAADLAHRHGRQVALTLSDPFCVDRWREEFTDLIDRHVDVLIANEVEVTSLYRVNDFELALAEARRHCRLAGAPIEIDHGARGLVGDGVERPGMEGELLFGGQVEAQRRRLMRAGHENPCNRDE